MTPDFDKYRKHIAELKLSEAKENALLQSLWAIMEGHADSAWGLDPVQAACGQVENNPPKSALRAPNEVKYLNELIAREFMKAAESGKSDQQQKAAHAAFDPDN